MLFVSKYRQNKLFYKILVILMAMSLLMFAVVYFFVYGYLYASFQERSAAMQRQMLAASSAQIDRDMKEITSTMDQLLYNEDIVTLTLLPEDVDYLKRSAVVKTLANLERNNSHVASAHLIVYQQGAVYHSNGNVQAISDFSYKNFLHEETVKGVSLDATGASGAALVTINGQAVLLQRFPTPEKNSTLMVFLDMYELFAPVANSSFETIQVVSQDNYLLFPFSEEDDRKVDPQPYSLSYTSAASQWSYRFIGPIVTENFGIGRAFIMMAPLTVVFLLMSIFLSTNVTYHIYRPINRLFQMAMDSGTAQGNAGQDELSFVQNAYVNAMAQRNAMSKQLAKIAPTIREKLYKNLLFGREMSAEQIRATLASSNSPFHYDDLFVVMVLAATTVQGEDCSELEANLLYKGLEHQMPSLMNDIRFDWLLTDRNYFIFILGFDASTPILAVKNTVLGLEKEILGQMRETGFRLFSGISKPSIGINSLFYCYELAEKDLNYQRYQFFEENETVADQWSERFGDQEQQNEIIESAIEGNRRMADTALSNFTGLVQSEAEDVNVLKLRFDRMLDAMTEKLVSLRASVQEMAAFEDYYQLQPPYDSEAVTAAFTRAAECALSALGSYGQKSKNRYIRQAKEYIEEHCSDSDLSLSEVAAYIGINPNYLSRLFYSSGEDNFIDTLNLCRIENAKLLLRQTGIPIKEIGFKTGFNSMQSFNRVFKKFTGITPSQYRKEKEKGV